MDARQIILEGVYGNLGLRAGVAPTRAFQGQQLSSDSLERTRTATYPYLFKEWKSEVLSGYLVCLYMYCIALCIELATR